MTPTPSAAAAALLPDLARRLDDVCDQFEAAWKDDRSPRIEDFLVGWGEPGRSALECELRQLDLYYRRCRGEPCPPADGVAPFPTADTDWLNVGVAETASADTCDPTSPKPWPNVGQPTSAGLRFRVLRPHAEGGLGTVSVALDEELHREVALKEIRDDRGDDPEIRARFLLEAEVTGGLEHPGVVPVYGLGRYADGRPFYATRFIRGDSLKDAIDRFHTGSDAAPRTLRRSDFEGAAFRGLLGRFVDVCNAIAYAHSRGVLHRDIKPANIMLGKYGETLVVDWGLAKPFDPAGRAADSRAEEPPLIPASAGDAGETLPGAAIGTPGYMSPEQAAGRWDLVGPASDIFSLGATLYAMLTGGPPFAGEDVAEVLQNAERGDYRPPQSIISAAPAALGAVCRTAMAPAPTERYGSALDLAADVERWLADEPVTAEREPILVRLRRWTRRHSRLVAATLATFAVGITSLGVATVFLSAANDRERSARLRAVAARNQTREALDAMISGVTGDALTTQKTLSPEQRKFLESVLAYYQEFAAEPGEDREGRERLAGAHYRLGMIRARLGQKETAAGVFRRAVELYGQLAADFPAAPEYLRGLARSHNNLGLWLADLGNHSESESEYGAALAVEAHLVTDYPTVPEHRQALATSHINLGNLFAAVGKSAEAATAYRTAQTMFQELAADFPVVPEYRSSLATSRHNLGILCRKMGNWSAAESEYRAALAIREKLAAEFPAEPDYRSLVAGSHNGLGLLLATFGRSAEAAAAHRRALEILEKLVVDFPGVTAYVVDLGGSYLNFGTLLRDSGRETDALAWYSKAIERLAPVAAAEPRLVSARRFLLIAHRGRAKDLVMLLRFAAALPDWDAALTIDDGSERAKLRLGRADCLARLGRASEAAAVAEDLVLAKDTTGDVLYGCAGVVSLASAALGSDAVERHAARAVELLRQAIAKGYANISHLLADDNLAPLRGRPDYAVLLWDLADMPAAPAKP